MNPQKRTEEESPGVQMKGAAAVVVIDDEESLCEGCRQTLEECGFPTATALDGSEGIRLVEEQRPNVVLVDLKMAGISGMEVLQKIPLIDPDIVPIVITGYGTIDSAVESMKMGAFDFLTKPFEPEKLLDSVRRGMKLSQLRHESQPHETGKAFEEIPQETKPDKQQVLLKGLTVLGESYSLGLEKAAFLEELRHLEAEAKYHAESLGQVKKREKAIIDIVHELRLVDDIIREHGYKKNALIQILLDAQLQLRWLPRHVLKWVSERLNIPLGEVYTIATFYEAFSLEPQGAHTVHVCMGTACHVKGAPELLGGVSALLNLEEGQTDSNQVFTLKTVHCLGCCALSPVIKIDEDYMSNPSLKNLQDVFQSLGEKEGHKCQS